jgi:hypothetical protein
LSSGRADSKSNSFEEEILVPLIFSCLKA